MRPPITYIPDFIPNADQALAVLRDELAWVRRDRVPRCEYYSNDFALPYVYGNGAGQRLYEPQPYHPMMLEIRKLVEGAAGTSLEVSFLNEYLDQSDSLGEHADDSPEMDDKKPIGIVSLGVEREIWFRANGAPKSTYFKQKLGHGSLCLMHAGMQDTWKHRIPKASFSCGVRISITLRGYVLQVAHA